MYLSALDDGATFFIFWSSWVWMMSQDRLYIFLGFPVSDEVMQACHLPPIRTSELLDSHSFSMMLELSSQVLGCIISWQISWVIYQWGRIRVLDSHSGRLGLISLCIWIQHSLASFLFWSHLGGVQLLQFVASAPGGSAQGSWPAAFMFLGLLSCICISPLHGERMLCVCAGTLCWWSSRGVPASAWRPLVHSSQTPGGPPLPHCQSFYLPMPPEGCTLKLERMWGLQGIFYFLGNLDNVEWPQGHGLKITLRSFLTCVPIISSRKPLEVLAFGWHSCLVSSLVQF